MSDLEVFLREWGPPPDGETVFTEVSPKVREALIEKTRKRSRNRLHTNIIYRRLKKVSLLGLS